MPQRVKLIEKEVKDMAHRLPEDLEENGKTMTFDVSQSDDGDRTDLTRSSLYPVHSKLPAFLRNPLVWFSVVLLVLIGLVFGMMFRSAIAEKNPFARAGVFFYILMMLFIPCNNQVGQTADNLLGFLMLILLWLIFQKQTLPKEETM